MITIKKKYYRFTRFLLTILILFLLTTGVTYGICNKKGATNEFWGEGKKPPIVDDKILVTVLKVWETEQEHPTSVKVRLYRDGTKYSDQILNAGNNWAYSWRELDKNHIWTVDEPEVPTGYTKTITGNAQDGFVIKNTRKTAGVTKPPPEEPEEQEDQEEKKEGDEEEQGEPKPATPAEPTITAPEPPEDISDSGTPTIGQGPDSNSTISEEETPVGKKDRHPGNVPKTGDDADPRLWLIILTVSTYILRHVLFFRKSKHLKYQE